MKEMRINHIGMLQLEIYRTNARLTNGNGSVICLQGIIECPMPDA